MSDFEGLSLEQTLKELLRREGRSLLQRPLLLDAYLRDLHAEQPALVFGLVEALASGTVFRLLARESERDCVSRLMTHSGLSGKSATDCLRLWSQVLPRHFYGSKSGGEQPALVTEGSIVEVIEGFRTGGKNE